jgi:hypothetical protein
MVSSGLKAVALSGFPQMERVFFHRVFFFLPEVFPRSAILLSLGALENGVHAASAHFLCFFVFLLPSSMLE